VTRCLIVALSDHFRSIDLFPRKAAGVSAASAGSQSLGI